MANQETYSAISGADIHAVFGNFKFGSIQMIRYATQREKAFIYTMGSPTPRATARGKRSVSGAFVFTMIDREGLVKSMHNAGDNRQIFLSKDESANFANAANNAAPNTEDKIKAAFNDGGTFGNTGTTGSGFNPYVETSVFKSSNFGDTTSAYLSDQLLPFDITIVGVPEYGSAFAKRLVIHGVEIMTEASGTSIDDLVIEKQNSFIAKSVSDWVSLGEIGGATGSGSFDRFSSW